MKKRNRQITAMALTLGMVTAGSMAAYGAATPTYPTGGPTVESVTDITKNGDTLTELIGRINVTSLKVTLPLKVAFDIDPSKYKDDEADALARQISNPSNYKITNESAVPVWVYISKLEKGDLTGQYNNFTLTDDTTKAVDSKNVLLAIKKADASITVPTFAAVTQDYWLKEAIADTNNTTRYFMDDNHGKLASGDVKDGTNEMNLKVYGLTKNGWTQGDLFAIKPTFTVSVEEPS